MVILCVGIRQESSKDSCVRVRIIRLLGRSHFELCSCLWWHINCLWNLIRDHGPMLVEWLLQAFLSVEVVEFSFESQLLFYFFLSFSLDSHVLLDSILLGHNMITWPVYKSLSSHLLQLIEILFLIIALRINYKVFPQTTLPFIILLHLLGLLLDKISIHSFERVLKFVVTFLLLHLLLEELLKLLISLSLGHFLHLCLYLIVTSVFLDDGSPEVIMGFVSDGSKIVTHSIKVHPAWVESIRLICLCGLITDFYSACRQTLNKICLGLQTEIWVSLFSWWEIRSLSDTIGKLILLNCLWVEWYWSEVLLAGHGSWAEIAHLIWTSHLRKGKLAIWLMFGGLVEPHILTGMPFLDVTQVFLLQAFRLFPGEGR